MNSIWSSYIQGAKMFYVTRALRFSDVYKEQYKSIFSLPENARILEIGCGPGALCGSLKRWYPDSDIYGMDRDSVFIDYAKSAVPNVKFSEGDATALDFEDNSFDATISNTVAEHIEPSKFFGEQYRVLKDGGVCLVLSTRKNIIQTAPCLCDETEFEREIWQRVEEDRRLDLEKYSICRYPMSEAEYPAVMEKYGFRNVTVDYVTVNLTPDDPRVSRETALEMINANRFSCLDEIDMLQRACSEKVAIDEVNEMKRLANDRFDRRIELYDAGKRQWDTNVTVIMVMRGVK